MSMSESGPIKKHLVRAYDDDIEQITRLITEMGAIVEQQVAFATQALAEGDEHAARTVIDRDPQVDALEERLDQTAIRVLAIRQPMAIDLRIIAMALKISNDLERMGDYAVNIAKRVIRLQSQTRIRPIPTMVMMSEMCQEMVKDILDAYIARDPDKAMAVWKRDQEVDNAHNSVFRELLTYMLEDPRKITPCIDLIFIAKNLERIGDHATNIAEKIHYMIHGHEINRSRDDEQ
ncbi:MAG TPA: phosphate signaling complex protein PhoU [Geminicoccus sp.]|uniref:phosphate signaling complex protein PhoU n=1 Tax=Geminicoccus sp. TaxID=2024832 RepID=UPI002CCF796A|nr:phosphate signaling complex protein PhoU [Geminicoccus sp.]HWL69853.1 phosphate signaling complex protein PhoU [Geminicoccus sp.]